jgi:DMSO/TMAO reductase YedYZ molybdopterin-dependent catalytic subunit
MRKIFLTATCIIVLIGSAFAQMASQYTITIEGEVLKPLKLTLKDLEKYPVTEVKAKDRDGKEHIFKGTLLSVALDSAGVTLGKQLRGENLVKYVLITAADNYQVIYSLPEIDPEFTSNTVLLTTHVDGNPLPKGEGPFRLVNPSDKKPARWIREITSIKVVYSKE